MDPIVMKSVKWKIVPIAALIILFIPEIVSYTKHELKKKLLQNYDKLEIPIRNTSAQLQVDFNLVLTGTIDIDEKEGTMHSYALLAQSWKDDFLSWDKANYSQIDKLHFTNKEVWIPDTYFLNGLVGTENLLDDFFENGALLMYSSEGKSAYGPLYKLVTRCNIDVTDFPFDIQTCEIKCTSWIYTYDMLNFLINPGEIKTFDLDKNNWILVKTGGNITLRLWEDTFFQEIQYTIIVKRNPIFYLTYIFFPSILLGFLSVFSVIIPPESGERISMGLTTLLSFAVFILLVSEITPESSDSVCLLGEILMILMGLNFIVLLWSVVCVVLYFRAPKTKISPMPCGCTNKDQTQNRIAINPINKVCEEHNVPSSRNLFDNTNGKATEENWHRFLRKVDFGVLIFGCLCLVGSSILILLKWKNQTSMYQ